MQKPIMALSESNPSLWDEIRTTFYAYTLDGWAVPPDTLFDASDDNSTITLRWYWPNYRDHEYADGMSAVPGDHQRELLIQNAEMLARQCILTRALLIAGVKPEAPTFHGSAYVVRAGRIEIHPREGREFIGGFNIGNDMEILIDGEPLLGVSSAELSIKPNEAVTLKVSLPALSSVPLSALK
jgi:hypothetical protein